MRLTVLLTQQSKKKQRKENTPCLIAVMMSSNQTMKVTPVRSETVIPDDPRVGTGLNTVPELGGFKQKVRLKDFYPLETVATTSTATDSKFGQTDDDVLVRFNPRYIGTTPVMSSSRRFDEETGLIESKTVDKQLFLDHTVVEAAVGRNTGGNLGHFGSAMATPEFINASNAHGYRLSSNQNRSGIEFGRCVTENTPS
jgi:hypothetical protein